MEQYKSLSYAYNNSQQKIVELEESLKLETLTCEEQRAYIEILKNALESKIDDLGLFNFIKETARYCMSNNVDVFVHLKNVKRELEEKEEGIQEKMLFFERKNVELEKKKRMKLENDKKNMDKNLDDLNRSYLELQKKYTALLESLNNKGDNDLDLKKELCDLQNKYNSLLESLQKNQNNKSNDNNLADLSKQYADLKEKYKVLLVSAHQVVPENNNDNIESQIYKKYEDLMKEFFELKNRYDILKNSNSIKPGEEGKTYSDLDYYNLLNKYTSLLNSMKQNENSIKPNDRANENKKYEDLLKEFNKLQDQYSLILNERKKDENIQTQPIFIKNEVGMLRLNNEKEIDKYKQDIKQLESELEREKNLRENLENLLRSRINEKESTFIKKDNETFDFENENNMSFEKKGNTENNDKSDYEIKILEISKLQTAQKEKEDKYESRIKDLEESLKNFRIKAEKERDSKTREIKEIYDNLSQSRTELRNLKEDNNSLKLKIEYFENDTKTNIEMSEKRQKVYEQSLHEAQEIKKKFENKSLEIISLQKKV